MTSTISRPRQTRHPRVNRASPQRRRARARPTEAKRSAQRRVLGRYTNAAARPREVISRTGADGSVLVIDRDAALRSDNRLVAHLGADEPAENAGIVCARYLDDHAYRGRCRQLTAADFSADPFAVAASARGEAANAALREAQLERGAVRAWLEPVDGGMSIPELRWRSTRAAGGTARARSLREVIAALESYEPACSITAAALDAHHCNPMLSTVVLAAELRRVQHSPIVLNRALRERVLTVVERGQLSMSEIAVRCGRVKRDAKGNESGETSWLGRRIGLLPDAGKRAPTAWVHSDVLALIARDGLGISPREVESP